MERRGGCCCREAYTNDRGTQITICLAPYRINRSERDATEVDLDIAYRR